MNATNWYPTQQAAEAAWFQANPQYSQFDNNAYLNKTITAPYKKQ